MANNRKDGYEVEDFRTVNPPDDILCATCKYKLKPAIIMGVTYDRSTYMTCDKFTRKPHDIVWDYAMCPHYEKEVET
jgi:hypothetical protein